MKPRGNTKSVDGVCGTGNCGGSVCLSTPSAPCASLVSRVLWTGKSGFGRTGKSRFGMSNPHFEFVTNEKEIRNPFLVVFVGFCVLLGNPKSEP